ncbi:MAG TPA: hypothetical protein VLX32_05560 [Candidatus Acidoferrum sp.]|nr:hypothetical protein [Candidatus Acidoferrum sp.]
MKFRANLCAWTVVAVGLTLMGSPALRAQNSEHAVSVQQLRQDVQNAADTRQANEAAVRQLLATDAAQKIMKSSNVSYKQVDQAVSQLSDAELARMAAQSRDMQKDFAAGNLTDRDLLIILLCIAALVLIIVAVR